MSAFPEYTSYDALGLADLVRRREVKSEELIEEAIARVERINPQINAVILAMYEEAREAARAPPAGPFAGVPFLIKDLQFSYAGVPLSHGSRFFKDYTPQEDSAFTRRLRAAGLITIGKTNTSEFGLAPVTEPDVFGPTLNPWNLARSPGGSSGGAAAAVAAGIVPMAQASDGGGSLRVPAACCGLFGLKPTRGRIPSGPANVDAWFGASVAHVISRSVRDSAAILDATAGPEPGGVYLAPPPARPYLEEVSAPPGALRVAVTTDHPLRGTVDSECVEAIERTAQLLKELGHKVEVAAPEIDSESLMRAFVLAIAAETRADMVLGEMLVGRKATAADFETETWLLGLIGTRRTAAHYVSALQLLRAAGPIVAPFFDRFDVLLSPAMSEPPVPIGTIRLTGVRAAIGRVLARMNAASLAAASGYLNATINRVLNLIPFTPLSSITGQPAMSVPLEWTADGLPIGAHFVGRFGDEATLFRLAAQLEQARPWFGKTPPVRA